MNYDQFKGRLCQSLDQAFQRGPLSTITKKDLDALREVLRVEQECAVLIVAESGRAATVTEAPRERGGE